MNEDIRDALAEEQGLNICPYSAYINVICNSDCDDCPDKWGE